MKPPYISPFILERKAPASRRGNLVELLTGTHLGTIKADYAENDAYIGEVADRILALIFADPPEGMVEAMARAAFHRRWTVAKRSWAQLSQNSRDDLIADQCVALAAGRKWWSE